ncbi:MAG TPA: hypothetical protein VEI55_02705 [Candidatus Acidoferrum sp.]|nr:hypothetical protein [Candidatus Acidoferrum sp.]
MDVGWLALILAVAIVFMFLTLVQHWQRVVRRQTWSIKRLSERVEDLESISDPMFVQRLNEAAPMPLEQVFTFSLRLDDRFWNEALHATEEEKNFVRAYGSFVGSVKLERWRSHTVASITEVLPEGKEARWQTRSLDLYSDPTRTTEAWTLWELPLSRPGSSAVRPPSIELLLRANSVELCGHLLGNPLGSSENGHRDPAVLKDVLFIRVPLDAEQLAAFRTQDPAHNGSGRTTPHEPSAGANSWQAFYSGREETLGIEWQLCLRDLSKRSEWERWKILESESPSIDLVSQPR